MQVVVFKLGGEYYAFDIQKVQEIVRVQENTRIPNLPEFVEGVVNLRGSVIPVINMARKFALKDKANNSSTRLIVLKIGEDGKIAVKADEVSEVLTINEEIIDRLPSIVEKKNGKHCLKGVVKLENRLIILLNPDELYEAEYLPEIPENRLESVKETSSES